MVSDGFNWEKTLKSISASAGTKLSSVFSDKGKDSTMLKTILWRAKRLHLIESILPLKWSVSSHRESIDILQD